MTGEICLFNKFGFCNNGDRCKRKKNTFKRKCVIAGNVFTKIVTKDIQDRVDFLSKMASASLTLDALIPIDCQRM